jgi:putative membrane protein
MVAWHLPVLYNAALRNDYLHGAQHMMFLVSGIFTWWVIVAPNPHWHKASTFVVAIVVAANSIPGMIVGALITFADPGLYSFYDTAPRLWNFSLRDDQQLAGTSMWAIAPMVYLGVLTVMFLRFAAREQKKDLPKPPRRPELTSVPSTPGSSPGN